MPTYNDLRPVEDFRKRDYELVFPDMPVAQKKRTIENLLTLRSGLDAQVMPRRTESNLLVASWNVKEFGHTTQRLPEAYFYMAEIISRFDLVIVQEVKSTLHDLYVLMQLLGDSWGYLINDITEGDDGNSERSAYIYNKSRVEFGGLAGEIALWAELTEGSPIKQLKRAPYITGFRAAWKSFAIVNLHLHPGKSDADLKFRREEVRLLLAAIRKKIADKRLWNENLILAGDFNFYDDAERDDPTIKLFADAGFHEVGSLIGVDTNASQTEAYDRLFLSSEEYFKVARHPDGTESGGVFRLFEHVYRDGEEQTYAQHMKAQYTGSRNLDDPDKLRSYYKHPWRKNQLSDHFPVWFELLIDSSDEFLQEKLAQYA